MRYLKGPAGRPGRRAAGRPAVRNIDEFKQLLLKDKDQLARALAEKLLTYATGAAADASRPSRRSRRSSAKIREQELRLARRWSTRSCRAKCFRQK